MRKIKYLFSAIVAVLMCCVAAMANEAETLDDYLAYTSGMMNDDGSVQTAAVDEGNDLFSCKRLLVEFKDQAYLPDGIEPADYVLYEDIGVYSFDTRDLTKSAYNVFNTLSDVNNVIIDSIITLNTTAEDVTPAGTIENSTSLLEKRNWGISTVHADGFKNYVATQDTKDVVVGIIDSGLATNHPYFKDSPRVIEGVNITAYGQPVSDYKGHGTNVAGVVMASTSDNVKIKMYQIYDKESASIINLYNAIVKATADGVDVLNMSLTANCNSGRLHTVLDKAYDKGIIITVAAGNGGDDNIADDIADPTAPTCPAHYSEHLIAVGAVDSALNVAPYSNYGEGVDICAPGSSIYTTHYNGETNVAGYENKTGTSMAAPFVASYAAMMKSLNSNLTYEEFCEVLNKSARIPEGWDSAKNGNGILDMAYVTTLVENIHTHKAWFYKDEALNEIEFEVQIENQTADPVDIYMHVAFLNDMGIQIGSSIGVQPVKSLKKTTITFPIEAIPDGTATIKGYAWTEGMEPVAMASEYVMPIVE